MLYCLKNYAMICQLRSLSLVIWVSSLYRHLALILITLLAHMNLTAPYLPYRYLIGQVVLDVRHSQLSVYRVLILSLIG